MLLPHGQRYKTLLASEASQGGARTEEETEQEEAEVELEVVDSEDYQKGGSSKKFCEWW